MFRPLLALTALACTVAAPGATHLILTDGLLIDGSGGPPRVADIEILPSGRLGRIGPMDHTDATVRSIRGLAVSPGFIDVHTHAENIARFPAATNFLRMGVTTLVLGNCGSSKLRVGEFFNTLEAQGISPNVATLIGHNSVRLEAMKGSFMRPPTATELQHMTRLVEQAMHDGALGLSTGLIYLPGTFARTAEITALARAAGAQGGLYVSHMRSEGDKILDAIDELLEISRSAALPAHVSHIKASGRPNWNRSREILARLDDARAAGLSITQDEYVYTASSTGISALIPQRFREGTRKDFVKRLADAQTKAQLVAAMKKELKRKREPDYSYAVIAAWKKDHRLDGLRIPEAAKVRRGTDSLADQLELIFEIHAAGGASGVYHKMIEPDIATFMRNPFTMFAADSSVREFNSGVPHPRGYGNNARALARYVREQGILSLPEAVRRMTSLPARTFKLKDRGTIRTGAWADLVVFDPANVQDRATFAAPHAYATGFHQVMVNGVTVIEDDQHVGTLPGKTLRRNR